LQKEAELGRKGYEESDSEKQEERKERQDMKIMKKQPNELEGEERDNLRNEIKETQKGRKK
jgi:hypothetical protein